MIELGDVVEHVIHDFAGVVTGRAVYLAGCVQVQVTARKLKDNEPNVQWFDESLVTLVTKAGDVEKEDGPLGGPPSCPPPAGRM